MTAPIWDEDGSHGSALLGLDAVDRQIRMNELRSEAKVQGMTEGGVVQDTPPEITEQFLRNVFDYEKTPFTTHFENFIGDGLSLPPPEELDDAVVSSKLWEVIHALARFDTYLYSTDHLCDRELYAYPWSESLREETPAFPPGSGWNCQIDLVGGGSDEDMEIYLRYYADEETRKEWQRDFPKDAMPPHEEQLSKRGHLLPRPPDAQGWTGRDRTSGQRIRNKKTPSCFPRRCCYDVDWLVRRPTARVSTLRCKS